LAARQAALDLVFTPERNCQQRIALAQKVLREVQRSFGEPASAGHAIGIDQAAQAGIAAHVPEVPDELPEIRATLDRPAMQRAVVGERAAGAPLGLAPEAREIRACGTLRIGLPERVLVHPAAACSRRSR